MRLLVPMLLFGPTLLFGAERKPNIIIIVGDDMGYADIGIHGCKDIPTPNLDALARSGVRLTSGYVSGPYCAPTRAGLLTGRYQTRFGLEFNPVVKGSAMGLPLSETTLADRLHAAGYVTGLIGKWHLGNEPKFHPNRRGFDEFFGFLDGAHPYLPGKGDRILRGTEAVAEKEYLTDAFGREAAAFIQRHKDQPFFLLLSFNAVHTPMQADEPRLKRFAGIENGTRRTYAAMMSALDDAVGRLMATLKEAGLVDRTLVAFISDNGGPVMPGTSVNGSRNTPLRGSKRTTLEGGIRVPFFLSWPGVIPPGKTDDRPVIQLDLTATALAAAGLPAKPDWKLDGVDLLPYLTGSKTGQPHEALFWRFGAQMAIRKGDWKLVRYDAAADGGKGDPVGPKLYNLAEDIGEMNDLAERMPAKVKELQADWDAWNRDNVPPLWGETK